METSAPVRIGTHDGSFHADEVLAVAILTRIYPKHHVVRTRDPDTIDWMDFVVDVGGIYDHSNKRYDHHMPNPPKGREGHLYSAAGLVWRHYARAYLAAINLPKYFTFEGVTVDLHDDIEKHIRKQWVEPIDRNDNGVTHELTAISVLVQAMRPTDPEKSKATFDKAFMDTVSMVSHLFERSCFHAADHTIAQTKHVVSDQRFLRDNQIVVSDYPIPSYRHYTETPVHFAISPTLRIEGQPDHHIIRPVPKEGRRAPKTPIPHHLVGARGDAIEKLTGITGVSYIHHGGWLVLADDEASAICFAEFCLSFHKG